MKLFKKVLSVVAAIALVLTVFQVNASAATDVLDFEDGKVPDGIYMALLDDGSPDGDPSILSVVDFNGSKMLKIDSQENATPKIRFDVAKLVGEDAFTTVRGIQYDLIIEQTAADTMVGWNGGTIGATPTGPSGWANGTEWSVDYWDGNVSPVTTLTQTLKDGFEFTDSSKAFFMFMNWANNGTDMYIDNVKLLTADGAAIPLAIAAVAVEKTETTSVPKTGTQDYSMFFLGGAAVLLVGAVVLKKRSVVK